MPKPTLNTIDVTAFLEELYGLSDTDLLTEANAVAADFSSWLSNQFALTQDEINYIDTYSEKVNKLYGYLFAAAFLMRGPISFPAIPVNPAPRRIKETRMNLFGHINFDEQDLDGTLEVNVEFDLL
ncbi:hypothetical protein [Sphingobacterium faecium]|uniref:hypothetical protein n=1 Tax=Sphingobacterium faecium TaxID=34087 RepID=UPI003209D169